MNTAKKLALAAACATGLAQPAHAGALSDPIIEKPIIVEDASSSSSQGVLVFLVLLTVIAAVLAEH